ncbi:MULTISPECIES: peptidoglycan editing factor PgeF [Sulfurimonas]|uniref:peptidoglycan editing factor PgeF n=1 Tax=Sulfurimonas TaxID=202746 RepID=UPI001264ADC4|nr:peptidoglycan editing factor PgeF [Sulfurimonas indica]
MQIFQSKLLNNYPNIFYTFTTKEDGNIAFHVGDKKENVEKNHEILAKKCNYKIETLVHMKQIHSNLVKIVEENDNFTNPPTCDALITNKKNIPLMVMIADCSPILFYDPKQEVIAVAHAGRAGAFNNIIHNVIKIFKNHFNSKADDIICIIGPAICQNCYEVGSEIYEEAKNLDLTYAFEKKSDKFYLNIRKILHQQLKETNILDKNIEISQICSQCNKNYYSYRQNTHCGRFCGLLYQKY